MDDPGAGGSGCGTNAPGAACSKPQGNTALGLCDMAGNVLEWVEDDGGHETYDGAPSDGSAWVQDPRSLGRVMRGGHYASEPAWLRSSARDGAPRDDVAADLGFRCAR